MGTTEKFISRQKDKGINCRHLLALIKVYNATGLDPHDVAEKIGVTFNTVRSTILSSRTYAPSLPMVEAYLEVFEKTLPGSKIYYSLLLTGMEDYKARQQAFKSSTKKSPKLDINQIQKESELLKVLVESLPGADYPKLINDLDLPSVVKLFESCLKKADFYNHLAQNPISPQYLEELVENIFDAGARPQKVGAKLSHSTFGKLMQGFSPNLLRNSVDDMDAKSLEKNLSRRGRKDKEFPVKK